MITVRAYRDGVVVRAWEVQAPAKPGDKHDKKLARIIDWFNARKLKQSYSEWRIVVGDGPTYRPFLKSTPRVTKDRALAIARWNPEDAYNTGRTAP